MIELKYVHYLLLAKPTNMLQMVEGPAEKKWKFFNNGFQEYVSTIIH